MRLPVAPATATARLWLAAVASAAVIGGAYLLESHGHLGRGRGGRGGRGGRRRTVPRVEPCRSPLRQGAGARGRYPDALAGGFARRHGRRRAPPAAGDGRSTRRDRGAGS